MPIYYMSITLASIGFIIASYCGLPVQEVSKEAANLWIILLWITMGVKPLTMVLMPHSECKMLTIKAIRNYFASISIKNSTSIKKIILTLLRRIACRWMKYRRLLGITTFLLIFTHGGIYFANWLNVWYSLTEQLQSGYLLVWYIGVLMLFVGYITSNNLSLKKFWKYRKPIQYTAYAALVLGILHVILLNPWEYRFHWILLIVYMYLKGVERGKWKFFLAKPSL